MGYLNFLIYDQNTSYKQMIFPTFQQSIFTIYTDDIFIKQIELDYNMPVKKVITIFTFLASPELAAVCYNQIDKKTRDEYHFWIPLVVFVSIFKNMKVIS